MTKKVAEKYLNAIYACKTRHLTCEALSHEVGIYPEIIAQELSFFEPMLAMDITFNLRELVPALEKYVNKHSKASPKKEAASEYKMLAKKYKSIGDFVYQKMTINGIVSKSTVLKDEDLKTLKVLVQNELEKREK